MTDRTISEISNARAVVIGLLLLPSGWVVYDSRKKLGLSESKRRREAYVVEV